jgi:hypothetical protein
MSNAAKGAATGAVQGAGAGAAVGSVIPGVGTVVGAVVGAVVGGVWGAFGGSFGDKAEKKLKQAKRIQKQREQDAYKQKLLSTLRQGRIQRSSALAAAVAANAINSSSTIGALSSIGSQIANQVEYMSVDQGRAIKIEQLTNKAKKLADTAEMHQQLITYTAGAVTAGANVYALGASASAAGAGAAGTEAVAANSAYAVPASQVGTTTTIQAMTPEATAAFLSQAPQAAALQVGPQLPASSSSWLNSVTSWFR